MTEQEVLEYYKELQEHYGEKLVNPEHHPRQFQWQVNTYRYYREKNEERS